MILIAYIPVLHQGYLRFLTTHSQAEKLYLLSEEILAEFDHLRKDIRRLKPEQVKTALLALELPYGVDVLTPEILSSLNKSTESVVLPDEDIMHELATKYLPQAQVEYDSVFLRWDRSKSLTEQEVEADQTIREFELDHQLMAQAEQLAEKSSDWWRQVGVVMVKDGRVIGESFNHHLPDYHEPHFSGDPRGNFHRGEHLDKSTAIHAEADVIAQAAKQGIAVEGASVYVTTFPCPACAKLLAASGIKKLYFRQGYAMVDGQSVLKENGVEIIRVSV